ncbi:MAG TPA: hypothetical protein VNJ70_17965 [Thermoanaerobaculia bacterium]|nr:hypothetical protein [Thermoanaerobaculia bacterium]
MPSYESKAPATYTIRGGGFPLCPVVRSVANYFTSRPTSAASGRTEHGRGPHPAAKPGPGRKQC